MSTIKNIRVILLFTMSMVIFSSENLFAQQFNLNNSKSSMSIFGTSSLHDWEEIVEEQSGSIQLVSNGKMDIAKLDVSIVAESIKSSKSAMDKNTYKALNTKVYKTISFKMSESKKVIELDNSVYQVTVSGKFSVAGVTKPMDLTFKMKVEPNLVTLEGEKTFNMTDFNIEPPKALFGTITTGDEITIKFKSILNK